MSDTRKRNTILTLVAWLKRILQSSSGENNSVDAQLTDLLPTELLLSKLMPQLSKENEEDSTEPERSASSKRFSRQRNKRFNTVGVSREELADARLYLQKKLLSENLATASASTESENILEDESSLRRKSLNIQFKNGADSDIDKMLDSGKVAFSKSIDIADAGDRIDSTLPTQSTTKVVWRRNPANATNGAQQVQSTQQKPKANENVPPSDTDDDVSESRPRIAGNSINRMVNKFTLRKQKMKRANTIDIPKSQFDDENLSDENADLSVTSNVSMRSNGLANTHQLDVDKGQLPPFQPKTLSDHKYLAFMNKQNAENRMSWMNPLARNSASPQHRGGQNWTSKFGNIKNNFERTETSPLSSPNKRNSFTHAPTSPFMPVPCSKPPQIPNGHSHHPQLNIVSSKVAAIQNSLPSEATRPVLRTHKSMPSDQKAAAWSRGPFSSVDHAQNHVQTSYNPLYVPLQSNNFVAPSAFNANLSAPTSHSPSKTPVSPIGQGFTKDFPSYPYTSTDFTQPECVSTYGPGNPSPIRTQILPDTSYIKTTPSPIRSTQPMLGTTRLSNHMKTVDYTSSSEFLSEPQSSHRSSHPNRIYAENTEMYASGPEEFGDACELTAKSQIMKYPPSQTATVINVMPKRYEYEEEQARNLQTYLMNNVQPKPQFIASPSPTYTPPATTKYNNFQSMENLSHQSPFVPPQMKSAISTHTLHSTAHNGVHSNYNGHSSGYQSPTKTPKMAKLNSLGSQYMPPKLDPTNPGVRTFRKQSQDAGLSHVVMNNVNNVSNASTVYRSNTIRHNRAPPIEIKRKQSLPAQLNDYEPMANVTSPSSNSNAYPKHNYLPSGVLKRSKSGHTLALLQQFESLEKSSQVAQPPPSVPKQPPVPLKSALKKTTANSSPIAVQNTPVVAEISPEKPFSPLSSVVQVKNAAAALEAVTKKPTATSPASAAAVTPFPASIAESKSTPAPAAAQRIEPQPAKLESKVLKPMSNLHISMDIDPDAPLSPNVFEERIIYPGQTAETRNKVQNYAQTLNAMLNRKSLIIDEEKKKNPLQKSKSGSLLSVPKQYESAIFKEEVEQKQKTVAAYFSGAKSPQGLQRSSSQHSVLSASSHKDSSSENIDINGNSTEIKSKFDASETKSTPTANMTSSSTTKTFKSAHHMKILQRQSKQTMQSSPLAKSQTMPHISSVNLLDESNVDDAFEDLFLSFTKS